MKKLLIILLVLIMVLGCVACKSNTGGKDSTSPPVTSSTPGNDATYGSKESVTAVYHGQKIKINDKERLIHLIREYAKFGNDRFLNQAINDNIINEFGKSGLKVSLVLGRNNSEISTAAFPSDAKVKKVYVLDHEYRWLVIRSDKMDAVFYLTESEIEEIYNCVDLPYEGVQ